MEGTFLMPTIGRQPAGAIMLDWMFERCVTEEQRGSRAVVSAFLS